MFGSSFGPMIHGAAGTAFGDSPLGWYIGFSYMFHNLTQEEDESDCKHYNAEGGLFYSGGRCGATAGYRYKKYQDAEADFTGFTVSFSWHF